MKNLENTVKKSLDTLKDWEDIKFEDLVNNILDEYRDTCNYSDFDFSTFDVRVSQIKTLDNVSVIGETIINKIKSLNDTTKYEFLVKFLEQNNILLAYVDTILENSKIITQKMQSVKLILSKNNIDLKKAML